MKLQEVMQKRIQDMLENWDESKGKKVEDVELKNIESKKFVESYQKLPEIAKRKYKYIHDTVLSEGDDFDKLYSITSNGDYVVLRVKATEEIEDFDKWGNPIKKLDIPLRERNKGRFVAQKIADDSYVTGQDLEI